MDVPRVSVDYNTPPYRHFHPFRNNQQFSDLDDDEDTEDYREQNLAETESIEQEHGFEERYGSSPASVSGSEILSRGHFGTPRHSSFSSVSSRGSGSSQVTVPSEKENDGNTSNKQHAALALVLHAFGLKGEDDSRAFNKDDMVRNDTVMKLKEAVPLLERTYYSPCKARVYLNNINERRAVTILKQVLRKHSMTLLARERNVKGKKMMYYQIIQAGDVHKLHKMTKHGDDAVWVSFGE